MALIICPDCGNQISTKAKACPKCGRSMVYWTPGRIILAIILTPIIFVVFSSIFMFCDAIGFKP